MHSNKYGYKYSDPLPYVHCRIFTRILTVLPFLQGPTCTATETAYYVSAYMRAYSPRPLHVIYGTYPTCFGSRANRTSCKMVRVYRVIIYYYVAAVCISFIFASTRAQLIHTCLDQIADRERCCTPSAFM